MLTITNRLALLLTILITYQRCCCKSISLRVYHEPSSDDCIWQGDAPFCFIGFGCPLKMIPVKTDKQGDGDYCLIGYKTYCCMQRIVEKSLL
ncbi:unnamed protein product [Rotaria sp. Silwood2]|nr:unnamed protein product [Rotaria sp. Silwood2]